MGMEPGGFVTIGLQGSDHTREPLAALHGGILEEFLDRGIEALAQQTEELAIVLEAEKVASGKEMARLSLIAAMLALRFVVIGGADEEGYGTMGPQATTATGDPGISNKELEEGRRFGERFARLTRQLRTPR